MQYCPKCGFKGLITEAGKPGMPSDITVRVMRAVNRLAPCKQSVLTRAVRNPRGQLWETLDKLQAEGKIKIEIIRNKSHRPARMISTVKNNP